MEKSVLSKNIRKLRAFKNLNQTEFAELLGIKRSSIGAYEEGRAEPKLEIILKISSLFKISINELITKELSVNEIAKFKPDIYLQKGDIIEEITLLKAKINSLEAKIDLLIDKSK
jgi:transcriptional regulator with XRE-family HTH domain